MIFFYSLGEASLRLDLQILDAVISLVWTSGFEALTCFILVPTTCKKVVSMRVRKDNQEFLPL